MTSKTRNRALLVGLLAVAVSTLGAVSFNPAQAVTSYGENRVARAEALAGALAAYIDAAATCDLNVAREAYDAAETIFNAIEIDHQFASPERYMQFEHIYIQEQVPASIGLFGDEAYPCVERVVLGEQQAATWAEIIEFMANSPEDSPLFNDVATLRTVNQGIRLAQAAIDGNPEAAPQTESTAPDPAAAAQHWAEFVADYPVARELIAFRNEPLALEIDGLLAAVTTAFEGDPAQGFPGASEALAALAPRYSLGTTLVTAAARNSNPTRPTFDPDHYDSLDFLGDIVITFLEMRDIVALNTPEGAAELKLEYDDWLAYPLSFKTGGALTRADVAMATAVDAYVAAQTPETTKAVLDQLNVVEQIFVGQYWGTPELVEYYAENQ